MAAVRQTNHKQTNKPQTLNSSNTAVM